MTASTKRITVHDRSTVAPAGEVAEQCVPLTYFDVIWLSFHAVQRMLFYQYSCSTSQFLQTIVPNLKQSLSQTLRHYLPVAGNLIRSLSLGDSSLPQLRYVPGDSVSVTFAESSQDFDFDYLTGNQAREADEFHSFVPDLPESRIESESGFEITPLLAIQVTIFPEKGICVGFTNHHVIGDASSIMGFIKAWSSVAKLGGVDELLSEKNLPSYDRSVIKDPSGRADIFWNQMKLLNIWSSNSKLPTKKLRSTYILQKTHIEKLKKLVLVSEPGLIHLSSFTVTTAYVWSCLAKSAADAGELVDDEEPEYFGLSIDARHRLDPPAPAAYFGNCLAVVAVETTHGKLKGEDGFLVAVGLVGEIISKKVNKKEELLRDADEWLVKYAPLLSKRNFGVAGSPKFDLYDTEFGWGKPNKYESLSIDRDGAMSLCKSKEFEGGLEIGLSLSEKKMNAFAAVFCQGIKI